MVDLSNFNFSLDKYGYLENDIPFSEKEIHIETTDTFVKNKKRYRKTSFNFTNVIGFDTETYKGKCKMICKSMGQNDTLYNGNFKQILDFMFYNARETKYYRFFYNLGFDISAILKVWNNLEQIKLLKEGFSVKYENYTLSYLENKLFTIKKNKKSVIFTDLWQFYKCGLDDAGFEYLSRRKFHNINAEKLNTNLIYWDKNYNEIRKYCLRDCEILKDLGLMLLKGVKKINIEFPKYLCSWASFSKAHFMKHCFIPNITVFPKIILEIAHLTYYGGRFEIMQRGVFDYAEVHDINSQYPSFTKRLPSFKYGRWKPTKILPKKETFGFYYVRIDIPSDYYLPTIPIRHKGIIKFPCGYFEGWYSWYDLDLIREYIIEINEGFEYKVAENEFYPFEKEIDNLFEIKAFAKTLKDDNKLWELTYTIVKWVINALYGCFVEKNENTEGINWGGRLFNPINATFITAFGRWSVIKDIRKEDYINILGIHTDSVTFDKPITYLKNGTKIGLWNKEDSGKSFIFGTGQYQIDNKIASRCYSKKSFESWFTIIKENKDNTTIKVVKSRMRKLSQALAQDKNIDRVNIMFEDKKEIQLNSDKKRRWDYEYENFGQMLTINAKSTPFYCIQKDGKNILI